MSIDDGKIHLIVGDTRPEYKGPEPMKLYTETVEVDNYLDLIISSGLLEPIFEKEIRREMRYTTTPIPDRCKVVIKNIRVVYLETLYFKYEWAIV